MVDLDMDANFVGKDALRVIDNEGIKRMQVGLYLKTEPLEGPNTTFWTLKHKDRPVGKVTSAIYSPRLKKNIALAIVATDCTKIGTNLEAEIGTEKVSATVVKKPFYDPKKKIAVAI